MKTWIENNEICVKGTAQKVKAAIKKLQEEKESAIKITYDVSCFDRELIVIFPNEYKEKENEILEVLDNAYCK